LVGVFTGECPMDNAILDAAAPELLEACRWAYDELSRSCPVYDNNGPIESPCMETIARLLNKIEGRP